MAVSLPNASPHDSPTLQTATTKIQQWEDIAEEDDNMLVKLSRDRLREEFLDNLEHHASVIRGIVSDHLLLSKTQQCSISDRSHWLYGDFNACIPITVTSMRDRRLLLRCPFPHMVGGPSGLDEKIRCEAATFAWISINCTRIPIPRLWGFGLPDGLSFKPTRYLPWYRRIIECIKSCYWSWRLRKPYCAPFVPINSQYSLKSGYLLVDFIEKSQGTMLSVKWPPNSDEKRRNFYESLSRIMLDLAGCPLPKIGSFTIHNSGEMTLSNRPLTARLPLLECEEIPTDIPRDRCYSTTESYFYDLLHCLDTKLEHQPNSIHNYNDGEEQMACLTTIRSISPRFTLDEFRSGPFYYIWTDPHRSNIFVNELYEITSLPDLEWFCSLPVEALHPPFWLSGHSIDNIADNRKDYNDMCMEFMEIFQREDEQYTVQDSQSRSKILQKVLDKGIQWFWASISQPGATYHLFFDHLQPRFAPTHWEGPEFQRITSQYWIKDAPKFIEQKLLDHEVYSEKLRSRFNDMVG